MTTVTAGESKSLNAGNYLLVAMKSGYYTEYSPFTVSSSSTSVATQMVQAMNVNQDRIVLSWGSSEDRDLHVIDKNDRTKKCGYTNCKSTAVAIVGGTVTLDKDVTTGPGVETTQLNGIATGTAEVWVNIYTGTYTQALVGANPSVLQVYCYKCEFDGAVKEGYVTTVTQSWTGAPANAKWWKAGEFTAPGTGGERATWTTCSGAACWDTASNAAGPSQRFSFPDATNSATGATISGATYLVYESYPSSYIGCGTECGTLVTTVTAGESKSLNAGNYLLVAMKSGYYTEYSPFTVSSSSTSVATQMVQAMNVNQDRIVLSWGSSEDRDLHVIDKNDRTKKCGYTNCKSTAVAIVGGTVTLDKDVTTGPGVETTQLNGIATGTAEVWVNIYTGTYTQALVGANPSVLQVYCYKCEFDGAVKEGYVTTVTQSWTGAPANAKWWKAGEFTAPGTGGERATWTTCSGAACWDTASNAAGPSRRSLGGLGSSGAVTNEKPIATSSDQGAVTNAKHILLPQMRYCNACLQARVEST